MPGDAQEKERAKADVRDLSRAIGHLRWAWSDLSDSAKHLNFDSSPVILTTRSDIERRFEALKLERDRIAEKYQIAASEYERFEEDPDDAC